MFAKLMKIINLLENTFLTIFTLSSIAIAFIAVFFRYFLKNALSWPEEITGFLLIGITVFGSSLAFKGKQHANVDLITRYLSSPANHLLSSVTQLISLFISFIMTILSIKLVINIYQTEQYLTSLEYMPMWVALVIFPIGFIFITLRCIEPLLNKLKG